jgi:hypothetical protein
MADADSRHYYMNFDILPRIFGERCQVLSCEIKKRLSLAHCPVHDRGEGVVRTDFHDVLYGTIEYRAEHLNGMRGYVFIVAKTAELTGTHAVVVDQAVL